MWKSYPSWFMFITMMVSGLLMVLSSDNWLICWIGLELSMLGFIPLTMKNAISAEGAAKYFLVQAGSSALLMYSFILDMNEILFIASLTIKLGMAPFFFWVPSVVSSLDPSSTLMLLTMQKLGPLTMLLKITEKMSPVLVLLCLLSVLIGGLGGMNQVYTLPMIAYSSIAHAGWTVMSSMHSSELCMLYFIIYSSSLVVFLKMMNTKTFKMSGSMKSNSNLAIMFLALSGLPPLPMFFSKLMVIYFMGPVMPIPILMMALFSALSAYFYMYNIIPSTMLTFTQKLSNSWLLTVIWNH